MKAELIVGWALVALAAGVLTFAGIGLVFPALKRHVLAAVTPRSSHKVETPEGAGIIVAPTAILVASAALSYMDIAPPQGAFYSATICAATLVLVVVGFFDDVIGLGVIIRLVVQTLCVASAVLLLPTYLRLLPPYIPIELERALIIFGGVWFLNVANFMDGIDLISAVETATITIGIMILAFMQLVHPLYGWIAAALLGAVLGFVPWNRPTARLFLGDSGSLAIGFLLGTMLLHIGIAAGNTLVAALILPLYYLVDATTTLLRRLAQGEKIWKPHREHFYQRATRRLTPMQTVVHIAVLNSFLVVLAVASTFFGKAAGIIIFAVALAAVIFVIRDFGKPGVAA